MTIQIARGIRGVGSPIIAFLGKDSNGTGAASPAVFVQHALPEVDPGDSDLVNVIDNSSGITTSIYNIGNVHYSEWRDGNDNPFTSSQEVVDYINNEIQLTTNLLVERSSAPPNELFVTTESVNTPFSHSVAQTNISGYFWDRATFPNGLEVSRYDRRVVTGVITQVGTYDISYETTTVSGTATNILRIDVV